MRAIGRLLRGALCLAAAAGLYLPCVHWLFRPAEADVAGPSGTPRLARKLAARHVDVWTQPELLRAELAKMRSANAEWDFMGRSFLVWSLANLALRDPGFQPTALEVTDRILDETIRLEAERGMYVFLMPYARDRAFVQGPPRSQFLDGEIALMLAMRCVVRDRPAWRDELVRRVGVMTRRMEASPSLSAESYPDECWTFCNTVALAAIRLCDHLTGSDHGDLIRRWVALARTRLTDPGTGLLVSAYRLNGETIYGPEGSSIWMACHCLALVDEPFAREQYERARRLLGRRMLGFGYAREWAPGAEGRMDIDSGLVVPGLGASVASTGLAMVAAGTFGDTDFLREIATSLAFAGFPVERDGRLYHAAGNQVGDAVALYGLVNGPVWAKIGRVQP